MSSSTNWYIVAYDISDSKRLVRLHKLLKNRGGLPLQKSVFAWMGSQRNLDRLIKAIARHIDESEDDVRIYPISALEAIDLWGKARTSPLLTEAAPQTSWQRLKRWVTIVRRRNIKAAKGK